jgi:hypothetical protein
MCCKLWQVECAWPQRDIFQWHANMHKLLDNINTEYELTNLYYTNSTKNAYITQSKRNNTVYTYEHWYHKTIPGCHTQFRMYNRGRYVYLNGKLTTYLTNRSFRYEYIRNKTGSGRKKLPLWSSYGHKIEYFLAVKY